VGKKIGPYNVIVPNMNLYRNATKNDVKKKGDLFNHGKWSRLGDEYIMSSIPNGQKFVPWERFYLVRKADKSGKGEG